MYGMQVYTTAGHMSHEYVRSANLVSGPHFYWNMPHAGTVWIPNFNRHEHILYVQGIDLITPTHRLSDTNRFDYTYLPYFIDQPSIANRRHFMVFAVRRT